MRLDRRKHYFFRDKVRAMEDVVKALEDNGIRRVPITYGKAMIGMITRADLMRAFVNMAAQATATPLSDDHIRQRLLAELEKQRWAPKDFINISVEGGVVMLQGAVSNDRQIAAMVVAAENIPGVSKVINQLVWVEPISGWSLMRKVASHRQLELDQSQPYWAGFN